MIKKEYQMKTTTIEKMFTGEQQLEIFKRMESTKTESELQTSLKDYFFTIKEHLEKIECDPAYMSYAVAHVLKKEGVTNER
jgi:hypothetical protein